MFKYHNDLVCYNQTDIAHDDEHTYFLQKHSTNEGTWELIQLTGGEVNFIFLDGEGRELTRECLNATTAPIFVPPAVWYKIEPISDAFYAHIEFYCKPHRYFEKKHLYGRVHKDLLEIYHAYIHAQGQLDVLDVGCGLGRNALYLALLGHRVTGVDISEEKIRKVSATAQLEKLTFQGITHDLHEPLNFQEKQFDWIISTVSLQFLNPARIASLLWELQQATRPQGLHCLVFPIQSNNYSLPATFTYLPESKELYHFYQNKGWAIIEYDESVGRLHKLDDGGRPIQGMFARLLAQKIR